MRHANSTPQKSIKGERCRGNASFADFQLIRVNYLRSAMSSRRNSPARPHKSVSFAEETQDPVSRKRVATPGPRRSRQLAEMTVEPEYVMIGKDEVSLILDSGLG